MHIGYICADPGIPVFGRKGASIHVQEVIRSFIRQGATVTLIANRFDGDPPPCLEDVATYRLAPISKGLPKDKREWAAYLANQDLFAALEASEPFDLIYERYSLWSYAGMTFAAKQAIPGLLEVNAPLIEEHAEHRGLVHRETAETVARHVFEVANAIVTVSDQVAAYVAGFTYTASHIHVVPNGVDVERFQSVEQPARKPADDTFTVGFVGSLKAWHGLDILAEQFAIAYEADPSMRLLIVGDGPGREQLESTFAALDMLHATHFAGAVDHAAMPAWLASMDAAIAPYPDLPDFYFSPLKIYEYMAAGLPVVASDIGQIADVIVHEENGILCPPGHADSLADATLRLRNNPALASRMGQAAQLTMVNGHTWDAVAERILELGEAVGRTNDYGGPIGGTKKEAQPSPTNPSPWRIIRRFQSQILSQWMLLVGALMALLAGIIFRLIEPWPMKFVVDYLSGSFTALDSPIGRLDHTTIITLSAIGIVTAVGARAVTAYFSTIAMALAGNRVLTQVRGELYHHLLHLSLTYHNSTKAGDLLTRLVGDIGRLQEVAVTALLPLLVSSLTLVGMTIVMLWINWQLTLLCFFIFPVAVLLMNHFSGKIRDASRQQRKRESVMAASASEAFNAMRVVQTFGLEQALGKSFASANKKSLKEGVRAKRLSAQLERMVDVFIALGTASVVWYGARFVQSGAMTIGDLIVFLSYLKSAFRPMRDMAKYTGRIAKAMASGERILDVLDRQPDIADKLGAVPAPPLAGDISFENIIFTYNSGYPILQSLNFEVAAGQRVALVGPSGAGKSTLTSLLLRLYDPDAGRILIDGRDIRDYTLHSLRSQISVVLQDSVLFGVSVRENIAYGLAATATEHKDPSPDQEEIETAARLANAHDFIMTLPDGYETILGEGGSTLSGGQRQRIAIARAAMRQAPIVILDEPTTSLDEENQHAVHVALERLTAGRTTILITHDLKAAISADMVLYVEDGQLCEQGTHDDLMQQDGAYAALYTLQNGTSDANIHNLMKADETKTLASHKVDAQVIAPVRPQKAHPALHKGHPEEKRVRRLTEDAIPI